MMNYNMIVGVYVVGTAEPGESANRLLHLIRAEFFEGNTWKRPPIASHYLDAHLSAIRVDEDPHWIAAVRMPELSIWLNFFKRDEPPRPNQSRHQSLHRSW
jgi:hypothetical protein